jgi:2,4-didehydro-3-deoxy-L-rhamnonate hydrolase
MRLIGYLHDGHRHIGAVDGDRVTPLGPTADFFASAGQVMAGDGETLPLAELEQVPFIPATARIFCVGLNYLDHAKESGLPMPEHPMIFGRWQQTLVSSGVPVPVPPAEPGLDWEAELAVIIKDTAWEVTEEDAMNHVFGYTAFNDLSARVKQLHTSQFTLGKNADRSGPIGPVLVTADEINDPGALRVQARVNGETVQDGNTSEFIYSIAQVISYITDTITLLPGDVIATGTPAGIGAVRTPPWFLEPGDVVEVEVEQIGTISTPVVSRASLCA